MGCQVTQPLSGPSFTFFSHIKLLRDLEGCNQEGLNHQIGVPGCPPWLDGLPVGGRPGARSRRGDASLWIKCSPQPFPHQRVKLHQVKAQCRPEAAFAANEIPSVSEILMLRGSCPSKACGQERGLCVEGVWGGAEAHPPGKEARTSYSAKGL